MKESNASVRSLPGRRDAKARAERIIEVTIELLAAHQPNEISMSQIADAAGISRTTVYGFFPTAYSIFEMLSKKYIVESIAFVRQFCKDMKPKTLDEMVDAVVEATVVYFNSTPAACTLLAAGGLEMRALEKHYDLLIAAIFHDLIDPPWVFKKFSERDPFRTLSVIMCAVFVASISRHHSITPYMAYQSKIAGKSYLSCVLSSPSPAPVVKKSRR